MTHEIYTRGFLERLASERGLELEMVEAVDGLNIEVLHRVVVADVESDHGAGAAPCPNLAIKVGQARCGLAIDADDNVATLDASLAVRTPGCHTADHQAPMGLVGVHAKPRPAWPCWPSLGQEIAEDRRQPVDRHEHVAGVVLLGAGGVTHDQ